MIYRETATDVLGVGLRLASQETARLGKPIVVSISERISKFEPIALFEESASLTNERAYWAQPDSELTLFGLGVAHVVENVESLRFRQTAADWHSLMTGAIVEGPRGLPGVGPLLLGGFAFDPQREPTGLWEKFPAARLVLPRLLFTKTKDEYWLTRSVVVDSETDIAFEALRLNEFVDDVLRLSGERGNVKSAADVSMAASQRELIPGEEWKALVGEAVRVIRREDLEKVVLARAVQLKGTRDFDAARALDYFARRSSGTYQFAFARESDVFLGATPEQLVRVREGKLLTMGLAGSMPRGTTPEQDTEFGQELLASAKDRNEQEIVVRAMREVLGDTCVQLQMSSAPTLLKLNSIQHLVTRFSGTLANGYCILDLLERLHPTPAVGGRPRVASMQWLREHERLDRGWYAGAVGWIDQNMEGEFAVSIRCALLQENQATLISGCGIVADSNPEREYAESALKLKPMLAALGLE